MSFARSLRWATMAGVAVSAVVAAVAPHPFSGTRPAAAQTAPQLAPPQTILPRATEPAQTPPKPAAHAQKPAVQAQKPATKPTAAAQKPAVAGAQKPAAQAQKPVPPKTLAPQTPQAPGAAQAVKPGKAKSPADVAQKVPPAVRRAAALAALTAQTTPPEHQHVFLPPPADIACTNPNAIGISRVLEVDTTGGLYLGQRYMNGRLPLEPKEVVLTFDDGPTPRNTERVLDALAAECTRASFFIVGTMAKAHPEVLRKVALAGHTIGYHTMTHPLDMVKRPLEWGKENISTGWKTVDQILYGKAEDRPANSFFRYPGLFNSYGINAWLNSIDVGTFAIDASGNDWLKGYLTATDWPNVMNEALKELEKTNGGILLLHDIKESSSRAVGPLLQELKARGFKIVHVVPKRPPPPIVDRVTTGSVTAPMVPPSERSLVSYDNGQQLVQEARGFTGGLPGTALPSFQRTAVPAGATVVPATGVRPIAVAPQPVPPGGPALQLQPQSIASAPIAPVAPTVPAPTAMRAPAAAAPTTVAIAERAGTPRSIADVIGAAGTDESIVPPAARPAPPAVTETSWLGSTGRSFRGIATAIGIW
jgi:peptidoglycan/xylan/chitin deacetylase (PgdA/CDA1 family)